MENLEEQQIKGMENKKAKVKILRKVIEIVAWINLQEEKEKARST